MLYQLSYEASPQAGQFNLYPLYEENDVMCIWQVTSQLKNDCYAGQDYNSAALWFTPHQCSVKMKEVIPVCQSNTSPCKT